MESNGEDASRILREIETLKAAKADIEHRISVLEARLRDIPPPNDAISGVSCSSMSIADSAAGHGLSPDMIYRYSRHLLLPSFGVQGLYFVLDWSDRMLHSKYEINCFLAFES